MTQKFKGDDIELQMEAAGQLPLDVCITALDEFFDQAFEASDFLLMLYDAGRMPFASRVPRDSFVAFIKKAIPNFPVTGTFEAYIFILNSVFGEGSGIEFDVPAPGKLSILVNAADTIQFNFLARELVGGIYDLSEIVDFDGATIEFTGIAGIDSEAALKQLLSEVIPDGISPDITLAFFVLYDFVAEESGVFYFMVDDLNNQIVFKENS